HGRFMNRWLGEASPSPAPSTRGPAPSMPPPEPRLEAPPLQPLVPVPAPFPILALWVVGRGRGCGAFWVLSQRPMMHRFASQKSLCFHSHLAPSFNGFCAARSVCGKWSPNSRHVWLSNYSLRSKVTVRVRSPPMLSSRVTRTTRNCLWHSRTCSAPWNAAFGLGKQAPSGGITSSWKSGMTSSGCRTFG
uniref:Uncharacterized protein n=1 Tax=Chrysemys picta bellii TaxID=8478 RepID=A0A8C3I8M6_CHRPI